MFQEETDNLKEEEYKKDKIITSMNDTLFEVPMSMSQNDNKQAIDEKIEYLEIIDKGEKKDL
jgi:hypothetical protein